MQESILQGVIICISVIFSFIIIYWFDKSILRDIQRKIELSQKHQELLEKNIFLLEQIKEALEGDIEILKQERSEHAKKREKQNL